MTAASTIGERVVVPTVARYLRHASRAVGAAVARVRPADRVPVLAPGPWDAPGSRTPGPGGWFTLAVEAESLGRTLPHEHVFILGQETLQNFNHRWGEPWWDEEARVADAVSKLQRLRDGGIETISDPTPSGSAETSPGSSASTSRST